MADAWNESFQTELFLTELSSSEFSVNESRLSTFLVKEFFVLFSLDAAHSDFETEGLKKKNLQTIILLHESQY